MEPVEKEKPHPWPVDPNNPNKLLNQGGKCAVTMNMLSGA